MHIQRLLVLVLLGLSLTAAADFKTVTAVYEADLNYLRLPGAAGGTLTFSECSDCDLQTLRVTAATRYVLNDRNVSLTEFKKALSRITNRKDVIIDVSHHLESNTVTRVNVKL